MVLEYADETPNFPDMGKTGFQDLVESRQWITRWRGDISPSQMTLDPAFVADDTLAPYSNTHTIDLGVLTPEEVPYDILAPDLPDLEEPRRPWIGGLNWLFLVPLPLLGWALRRRS